MFWILFYLLLVRSNNILLSCFLTSLQTRHIVPLVISPIIKLFASLWRRTRISAFWL